MKSLLLIASLVFSFNVFSHGSHGHHHHNHTPEPMGAPVEAKRLPKVAKIYVINYVKRGALAKTWNDAKHFKTVKNKYRGQDEWIVSFKNEKEKDKKKQIIYVFMRLDGKLIAANFKGK